jgi:predicted RNase H-like HicB family nuclease
VREAILMYLEELKESGELVPPPSVQAVEIEVAA